MSVTITQLLHQWNEGNEQALEHLLPLIYDQLRAIAFRQLDHEQHVTLQPTELVHETFLRLTETHSQVFRDRVHFYGAVAELMRRILIDLARRRATAKRGATFVRVELQENSAAAPEVDFEALDQALDRLQELDVRQANVVKLRFFGGLNNLEVADALQVSEATVKRDWAVAKAWLLREISGR